MGKASRRAKADKKRGKAQERLTAKVDEAFKVASDPAQIQREKHQMLSNFIGGSGSLERLSGKHSKSGPDPRQVLEQLCAENGSDAKLMAVKAELDKSFHQSLNATTAPAREFSTAFERANVHDTAAMHKLFRSWARHPSAPWLNSPMETMARFISPAMNDEITLPMGCSRVQSLHNAAPLMQRTDEYAAPLRMLAMLVHCGLVPFLDAVLTLPIPACFEHHRGGCSFYHYYASHIIRTATSYTTKADYSQLAFDIEMRCHCEDRQWAAEKVQNTSGENKGRLWFYNLLYSCLPGLLMVACNSEAGALVRLEALRAAVSLLVPPGWFMDWKMFDHQDRCSNRQQHAEAAQQALQAAAELFAIEVDGWVTELSRETDHQPDILSRSEWTEKQTAAQAPHILTCIWRDAASIIERLTEMLRHVQMLPMARQPLHDTNLVTTIMGRVSSALADPWTIALVGNVLHHMCHERTVCDLFAEQPGFVRFLMKTFEDPRKAMLLQAGNLINHLRRMDPEAATDECSCITSCECGDWFEVQLLECLQSGDMKHVMNTYWDGTKDELRGRQQGAINAESALGLNNAVPYIQHGWLVEATAADAHSPGDFGQWRDQVQARDSKFVRLRHGTIRECWKYDETMLEFVQDRLDFLQHPQYIESCGNAFRNSRCFVNMLHEICVLADCSPLASVHAAISCRQHSPLEIDVQSITSFLGLDANELWTGLAVACVDHVNVDGQRTYIRKHDSAAKPKAVAITGFAVPSHNTQETDFQGSKVNAGWREKVAADALHEIEKGRRKNATCRYLTVRVKLVGVYPEVWRVIKLPAATPLNVFHDKLLCPSFGFKAGFHMYLFQSGPTTYGPVSTSKNDQIWLYPDCPDPLFAGLVVVDAAKVTLWDAIVQDANSGDDVQSRPLKYWYDLGERFLFSITVESVGDSTDIEPDTHLCLDGSGGFLLEETSVPDFIQITSTIAAGYGTDRPRHCASCSLQSSNLKWCSRCKSVMYCSVDCQRTHHKMHKLECQSLKGSGHKQNPPPGTYWQAMFRFLHSHNIQGEAYEELCLFNIASVQSRIDKVAHKSVSNMTKQRAIIQAGSNGESMMDVHVTCAGCGVSSASAHKQVKMKKCNGCLNASYCSTSCQQTHWPTHSALCKK